MNHTAKEDKDEICRFIKAYLFSTGRDPKISYIVKYTSLEYPKIINTLVQELVKENRVEIIKDEKEFEVRLLPTT